MRTSASSITTTPKGGWRSPGQDESERSLAPECPWLSVSLWRHGAVSVFGGARRRDPVAALRLESGDAFRLRRTRAAAGITASHESFRAPLRRVGTRRSLQPDVSPVRFVERAGNNTFNAETAEGPRRGIPQAFLDSGARPKGPGVTGDSFKIGRALAVSYSRFRAIRARTSRMQFLLTLLIGLSQPFKLLGWFTSQNGPSRCSCVPSSTATRSTSRRSAVRLLGIDAPEVGRGFDTLRLRP